jgi:hypothetical protein
MGTVAYRAIGSEYLPTLLVVANITKRLISQKSGFSTRVQLSYLLMMVVSPMLPLVAPCCDQGAPMPMAMPERHRFAHGMSTPVSGTPVPLIHDHKPRAASSLRAGTCEARRFER